MVTSNFDKGGNLKKLKSRNPKYKTQFENLCQKSFIKQGLINYERYLQKIQGLRWISIYYLCKRLVNKA